MLFLVICGDAPKFRIATTGHLEMGNVDLGGLHICLRFAFGYQVHAIRKLLLIYTTQEALIVRR